MKKLYLLSSLALASLALVSCGNNSASASNKAPNTFELDDDCAKVYIKEYDKTYARGADGLYHITEDALLSDCCYAEYDKDTKKVTISKHYYKENEALYSNLSFEITDEFKYCYAVAILDTDTNVYAKYSTNSGYFTFWTMSYSYADRDDCCLCKIEDGKLVLLEHSGYDRENERRAVFYGGDNYFTVSNFDGECCDWIVVYDEVLKNNVLLKSVTNSDLTHMNKFYSVQYYYDNTETNYCSGTVSEDRVITITKHNK